MRNALIALAILIVLVLAYVWFSFQPPGPPSALSESFTLDGVTVLNPGEPAATGMHLAVRDGVITEVLESGSDDADALSQFRGMYVTPGLVDMHVHLPPDNVLKLTQHALLLYLAHGVTSVRDAGDVDGTATPAAKALLASGEYPGPRIFSAGPFVSAGEARWPNSSMLETPDDAKQAVEIIAAGGNTWVKSYEGLSLEMIRALEEAADDSGLQVMGHVPDGLAYEEALIRDVQHFLGVAKFDGDAPGMMDRAVNWSSVDAARMQEIVDATLEHKLANTPTLVSLKRIGEYKNFSNVYADPVLSLLPDFYLSVVWNPERGIPLYRDLDDEFFTKLNDTLVKKQQLVKRLHDAGAQLYIGTDTLQPFLVPGASLHEEMMLFADAGVPSESVWKYAAHDAGEALELDGLGAIRKSAPADLLIFRENPIEDLTALDSLEAVIAGGRLYLKADLDEKAKEFQAHYEAFPVKQLSAFFAQLAVDAAVKNIEE